MKTLADGRSENYGGCVVIQPFFSNIFCFHLKIILYQSGKFRFRNWEFVNYMISNKHAKPIYKKPTALNDTKKIQNTLILLVFAKFKALIDALEFNDPFRQNVENLCRFFVILRTVVRRRPKVQNHIFADNLSTLKCKENYLSHNVQFIDIRFYFEENMFFWFHPN